jgi:ABC-type glycerol-3-phosphate transport system permease component
MAADVFVIVPILIGFVFLQRHLTPTALTTGVK